MRMKSAAGTRNVADGTFWGRVVNRTVGRGRERILVPVNVMVSELDTSLVREQVLMGLHTYIFQ
jgi:hypothetical protein